MDPAIRSNRLKKVPRAELVPGGILILALFSGGNRSNHRLIVSPASAEDEWEALRR
jgi:hypothetical protein